MDKFINLFTDTCLNRKQYDLYQESLKNYWDLNSSLNTAFKEGKQEGLEEGLQMGLEEGIQIGEQMGLEKGKELGLQEGKLAEKYETAKKCLLEGFSVEMTAKITELSVLEVQKIAKDLEV